jgi:membrane associated rhomboid family serine protease
MSMWSINTWIIAINALVFVADRLLIQAGIAYEVGQQIFRLPDGRMLVRSIVMGPLEHFGYFSADTAITHVQMWRFLSFQFLHANLSHIFFNMLALYFFGPLIEQYLGSRRYLVFYLLCGVVGPIAYLMLWGTGILVTSADAPMIGASAGVYGVLIATATIAPNAMVMLLFPPIPMKLKTLAWVFIGLAVFVVVTGGRNAGGEAAHLGGALAGWYLIRHVHLLNLFAPSRRR